MFVEGALGRRAWAASGALDDETLWRVLNGCLEWDDLEPFCPPLLSTET